MKKKEKGREQTKSHIREKRVKDQMRIVSAFADKFFQPLVIRCHQRRHSHACLCHHQKDGSFGQQEEKKCFIRKASPLVSSVDTWLRLLYKLLAARATSSS